MLTQQTIMVIGVVVLIGGMKVIRMLLAHQRQMTELIHRVNVQQNPQEPIGVQQEMQELKQLVQQQAIALDNLTNKIDSMNTPGSVRERINS